MQPNINTQTLDTKYHEAIVSWQKKNFPDLKYLEKYWANYFPKNDPFNLMVKTSSKNNNSILHGQFAGNDKITRARDMKGNMLYGAMRIITAQCSTELGSIQQHIETVDDAPTDLAKFSILRIMAEELRHAYQMFWVIAQDASWSSGGMRNLSDNVLDELLSMETGTHVLDAFNIEFIDPLDNIVFAFFVDRVGKYQLSMQRDFSYVPMARSMEPMLKEESFHLYAGKSLLEEIVLETAKGLGKWSLQDVQQRINLWYPRALEMFGSEDGGQGNISYGFKDKLNGTAAREYQKEVTRLIRQVNEKILTQLNPELSAEDMSEKIERDGSSNLLSLPSPAFFRIRGAESVINRAVNVEGEKMPVSEYLNYMEKHIHKKHREQEFYQSYITHFMSVEKK